MKNNIFKRHILYLKLGNYIFFMCIYNCLLYVNFFKIYINY